MKKLKRQIIAMVLVIIMITTILPPVSVIAETQQEQPVLTVGKVSASPGDTVDVSVILENNPGIVGATLRLEYGEGISLEDGANGEAFSKLTMTKPGKFESPCNFLWDSQEISEEDIKDGSVLKLTFKVSDGLEAGAEIPIKITCEKGDVIKQGLLPVDITVNNGFVSIDDYLAGDLNNDKSINTLDVILMRRYIAGGYDIAINEDAADVNADGSCNTLDVILLRRYIAGGYGVELVKPGQKIKPHEHELQYVEFKAATCTEDGNIAYWYCQECDKYYSDEAGTQELEKVTVEKTGHTEVIDPAVEPTATTPGKTEGSHCSVCGAVIVPQKPWNINAYSIKYDIANGDSYLAKLEIDNPNPATIAEGASYYLEDLKVEGYRFLGWYLGAGNNAQQITKIENADHNMTLYAHWEVLGNKIEFKSDLVPVEEMTYTTNEGKVLPTPTLDGYTFVGWTDFEGNMYNRIRPGTTGNVVLYANWISDRNKAWAKNKLDEPLIYENDDVILFTYEIGEIRDVPIYEIENFGKINKDGVPQTVTKKYSVQTSENLMKAYTKAVEKATTASTSWTLSNGWSDSVSVSEEWCKQNGVSVEEAETRGKSDTGNWYVSNSKGGSSTSTVIDSTDTHSLVTDTNNSHSWSDDYQEKVDHGDDVKTNQEFGAGLELNGKYEASASAPGVAAKAENGWKVDVDYKNGKETTKKGSDTTTMAGSVLDTGRTETHDSVTNHTSNTSNSATWNTESGYGGSSTTSQSKTVAKAVSEMISEKTGYGKTYIGTGGEESSQGQTDSTSSSDTYGSSVTYSTARSEETEVTFTTSNTKSGYHRWVMAGTAHVFGVVGYDIATDSYFVYTYSVMDDEMHRFEDYSYNSAAYDDNQSGIIPFSIPTDAIEYVNRRTFASDGLEIDLNGMITDYTGTDSYVVIPDYKVVDNKDGSKTVIKVTGLGTNRNGKQVFEGNTSITGVKLSRFIEDIPDNAFTGCTNLWQFESSAKTIGKDAFKGCPLLEYWSLTSDIASLGTGTFADAYALSIKASKSDIVKSAIHSGAQNITVGLDQLSDSLDGTTLDVPAGTESICFNGYGNSFNNLTIISDADETVINRVNIESAGAAPLQISSPKIWLNQSSIKNSGICAAFTASSTDLDLYGVSNMETSGPNALLCRSANVGRSTIGLKTALSLSGNLVTCGTINDPDNYITFKSGQIVDVDEVTFEKMLHSYTLSFDANGGQCDLKSKEVANATPVGELPVATREGFDFEGWFLEDAMTQVTESTIFSTGMDQRVHAKWKPKEYTVNWKEGAGYTVTVERTESPNAFADAGAISNSGTVYYGDVLKISYTANDGYSIDSNGITEATVSHNITSDDIYARVWSDWSEWSETPVEASEDVQVESKTQYRYSTKDEKTSTSSSMSGYTQSGSSTSYGNWGAWSAWNRGSKASSDTVNVEAKTVYGYYYFRCPNCGAHMHGYPTCYTWAGGCGKSNISMSNAVNIFDPTPWSSASCYEFHGTGKYATDKLTAYGRLFQWSDNGVNSWAGYRYRTRSKTVTYSYYKWLDWSAWGDDVQTATDKKKVETRTVYRTKTRS